MQKDYESAGEYHAHDFVWISPTKFKNGMFEVKYWFDAKHHQTA